MLSLHIELPSWLPGLLVPGRSYSSDEERMRLVIELARENVLRDNAGPFGAAVFDSATGQLIAAGVNRVLPLGSSVLHAEVVAIMLAQKQVGRYALSEGGSYELVASCEPCAMCLGAYFWSGARRLVYGASGDDARDLGFDEGPVFPESYRYLRERGRLIQPEVLRAEAREVLQLYKSRGGLIYNP